MNAEETVRTLIAALERQQWDEAATLLSDDFVFRDALPPAPVADKSTFLAAQRALIEAAPDWSFNLHVEWARGNAVAGSVHIRGTHTANFVSPTDEHSQVPASGLPFDLPRQDVKFLLVGDAFEGDAQNREHADAAGDANGDHGPRPLKIVALAVTLPPGSPTPTLFESPSNARQSHAHLVLRTDGTKRPLPCPPRLADVVGAASFPVYGIAGQPLGLTLRGLGVCSSGPREHPASVSQLSLPFAAPLGAWPSARSVELISTDPAAPITHPPDWRTYPPDAAIFTTEGHRFARYATLASLKNAEVCPDNVLDCVLIDRFPLAGEVCAARIEWSRRPEPEARFWLLAASAWVAGKARGLDGAQLLALLEGLVPINDQPRLLAQYQDDQDAWGRLFRGGHPKP